VRTFVIALTFFIGTASGLAFATDYTTFHFDNWRTGWNSSETTLTPALVAGGHFGEYMSVAVDGEVDAQPLYVENESIPGQGTHSLAIIATENDSLYAIDVTSGAIIWQTSFGTPVTVDTPATKNCVVPNPYAGILSTPVIVRATDSVYVVAYVMQGTTPVYQLHDVSLATGVDKTTPFTMEASTTPALFDSAEAQRPALLFSENMVYVGFGSFCDSDTTTSAGQIYAFSATGALINYFLVSRSLGSLWGSNFGPAADASGNVYFATGNGMALYGLGSYAQAMLKLNPTLKSVLDYFAPTNAQAESDNDLDLSSGGVLLLPDEYGPYGKYAHVAVAGGKTGETYLLDRDDLGKWAGGAADKVPFELRTSSLFYGGPCFWRDSGGSNYLGITGSGQPFSVYRLTSSLTMGLWARAPDAEYLSGEGGDTCTVSSNGTDQGSEIVWVVDGPEPGAGGDNGPMYLEAYSAANPDPGYIFKAQAGLWGDGDGVSPPAFGAPFGSATVADGRVIVGSNKLVTFWESK
jgi:hypothetical protein